MKFGSLELLEPSGPVQAYNGIALPLPLPLPFYPLLTCVQFAPFSFPYAQLLYGLRHSKRNRSSSVGIAG